MTSLRRAYIARLTVIAACVVWALPVSAQPRTAGRPATQPREVTGIIEGRVTAADSGSPVRAADIRLREPESGLSRATTTDAEGRFEARDLPPGNWLLTVSKGGFITHDYGQRRPLAAPQPIALGGERVRADVAMIRGGAIAGRVTDEFGEPVAVARVQLLRSRLVRGRRIQSPVALTDQTDDTGAFRLYGLPPGSYYVGVTLRAAAADVSYVELTAGGTAYYPGTPDISEAQRVTIGPGDEQLNVNVQLRPFRPVKISGTVTNAAGAAADNTSVELISTSDFTAAGYPIGNFGMTHGGGGFTIVNAAPGSYLLTARSGSGAADSELAVLPLTVGDDDIAGLALATSRGATIRGTVVADSGATLPASLEMSVAARAVVRVSPVEGAHEVAADRTFEIPGVFGSVMIEAIGVPDGWMVKQVEVNGQDVSDGAFDVGGANALNARILLTNRVGVISGLVVSDNRPVPQAHAVVFPSDPAKWSYPSRFIRAAMTDGEGRFTVSGLPAHDQYLIAAVDYLDADEQYDAEQLQRIAARANTVSLADGEQKAVSLPLGDR